MPKNNNWYCADNAVKARSVSEACVCAVVRCISWWRQISAESDALQLVLRAAFSR